MPKGLRHGGKARKGKCKLFPTLFNNISPSDMPLFVTITFLTQPLNWILFSNLYDGDFQLGDAASGTKAKSHHGRSWERHNGELRCSLRQRGLL